MPRVQEKLPTSSTTKMTGEDSSLFLRLPAELRNTIYRMVLKSERTIFVGRKGLDEPSFLRVCKQIRREANAIFLAENKFVVLIGSYRAIECLKWDQKVKAARARGELNAETRYTTRWSPPAMVTRNWNHLLVWLRNYHDQKVSHHLRFPSSLSGMNSDARCELLILGGLFATAAILRGQPWQTVENILKEQHYILARHNPEWSD